MLLRFRCHPGLGFLTFLFFLTCSSGGRGGGPVAPVTQTGAIQVATTTTGEAGSLDGNGFTVAVDGSTPRSIGINATMTFQDQTAGTHMVRLDGAAENCAVAGDNPRSATVPAGGTVQVAFTITCASVTGTIDVSTITVGGTDPDGYTISVDGGASQSIGTAETKTFVGLTAGTHNVLLGGLAAGCTINGANPRALIVIGNRTSSTIFNVACPVTGISGRIAFYSDRDGDWEIFVMNADGSSLQQLTVNSAIGDAHPSWSPDGTRIAFVGTRQDPITGVFHEEVLIMNADGSNEVAVTRHPLYDASPGWSSGNRIAFQTNRDDPNARPFDDIFPDEIYTINPDGTDLRRVTNNARDDIHPDWSPDGGTIVYSSEVSPGNYDILTTAPDGTGIVNLTNHPATDWRPAWSPDGTRIAFHSDRDGNFDIYVMNTNGTGLLRLTTDPGDDFHPAWSPDSRMIAFQSTRTGGDFDIFVMNADGTGVVAITDNPANDDGPNWTR
ncbi:MAG TPA: hypothetical protein VEY33_09060 [Gemmatimonadota bacterium]|nr:hypothetical protein [Gemmatimonadota bacterium]